MPLRLKRNLNFILAFCFALGLLAAEESFVESEDESPAAVTNAAVKIEDKHLKEIIAGRPVPFQWHHEVGTLNFSFRENLPRY